MCPANSAPGALSNAETPQFVLFTVRCPSNEAFHAAFVNSPSSAGALRLHSRPHAFLLRRPAAPPRRLLDAPAFNGPAPLPLQHGDALNNTTVAAVRAAIAGRQHSNGCPIPVTMFASLPDTSCRLVAEVHSRGWEIADHILTHRSVRPRAPCGHR